MPLKHGMCGSPEYSAWLAMKQRTTTNRKHPMFRFYGARGITTCKEWRKSFTAFFDDIGPKPTPSHTLEREDNNEGYSPGNVRWATRREQARNRRSNSRLTAKGKPITLFRCAELSGLNYSTARARNRRGWSTERLLSTPTIRAQHLCKKKCLACGGWFQPLRKRNVTCSRPCAASLSKGGWGGARMKIIKARKT